MATLVSGNAGFIGFHLARALLSAGEPVVGIDNLGAYYDPLLKRARLAVLARRAAETGVPYRFIEGDVGRRETVEAAFAAAPAERVIHLAAQPGIGFSTAEPLATIDSNIGGFVHMIEASRRHGVHHFLYASTSSVYGAGAGLPYGENADADHPLQLYAASKRANELLAHAYGHLHGLRTTGLRFFTAYGPWGRPDMAIWKFTASILAGKTIELADSGEVERDFTFVDDLVQAVLALAGVAPAAATGSLSDTGGEICRIFNVGSGRTARLLDVLRLLEQVLGREAKWRGVPRPRHDMARTQADVGALAAAIGFTPQTPLADGLARFAGWYRQFHAGAAADGAATGTAR